MSYNRIITPYPCFYSVVRDAQTIGDVWRGLSVPSHLYRRFNIFLLMLHTYIRKDLIKARFYWFPKRLNLRQVSAEGTLRKQAVGVRKHRFVELSSQNLPSELLTAFGTDGI